MSKTVTLSQPTRATRKARHTFVVLCCIQGIFYLLTGVWPLVSIETFQMVTGPKTDHLVTGRQADHWLVNTVGVLIAANALVLLVAAWRGCPTPEVVFLAIGSAIGLAAIDAIYVAREVILPVYLADAAVESAFVAAWIWVAARMPWTADGRARTMARS